MKRILSLLVMLIAVDFSYAQTNTFPSTGNVGIGTTTPSSNLTVVGDVASYTSGTYSNYLSNTYSNTSWHGARIGLYRYRGTIGSPTVVQDGDNVGWFNFFAYDGSATQRVGQLVLSVDGTASNGIVPGRFTIATTNASGVSTSRLIAYANDYITMANNSGKVGIGTTTPAEKLHIIGNVRADGAVPYFNLYNTTWTSHTYIQSGVDQIGSGTGNYLSFLNPAGKGFAFSEGSTNVMTIGTSGNIGIGTTSPDAKLAVNGTIHSKQVKVDLTGWPDYVFKPQYNLPSLTEVKKHIDQNQHLPDMPSETEVAKNGVDLGEIVKLQTKKIEELTLYLIEQQKEVEQLKQTVKDLSTQQYKN
jgi:hypothetical protein